ncbi:hypothetical protein HBI46_108910 [Parastagonospora nodorum]|nr:hypothetical protein HBI62_146930 [Parastagonospora nodorum]KAH5419012.1 hypothetical protein HBI46_108910 [Parastagonospora nodorum]KAH6139358.1 hypothetical protein HBI63_213790 [Parastagonospora nodorum]KAH6164869.1 hypothetical protein HBI61_212590 [Parastagonospora nodorum]KAH6454067.1 hypothetical protein HBI57_144830 [Parastagonospora nodorum]
MESTLVSQPDVASNVRVEDATNGNPTDDNDSDTKVSNEKFSPALNVAAQDTPQYTEIPIDNSQPHPQHVQERLAVIETKIDRFVDLFDPPKLDESLERERDMDYFEDQHGEKFDLHRKSAREYLEHVMWFMGHSRREFELSTKARREREESRKEAIKKDRLNDDKMELLEELCATAYMEGRAAEMDWMGWLDFIKPKGSYENSALFPLTAAIGDPEPQIILPIYTSSYRAEVHVREPMARVIERPTDHGFPNGSPSQELLPERIKIHSEPLARILIAVLDARLTWNPNGLDGSNVFLRPFREFIYYEKQLREYLEKIEARFKRVQVIEGKLVTSMKTGEGAALEDRAVEAGDVGEAEDASDDRQLGPHKATENSRLHPDQTTEQSRTVSEDGSGHNSVASLMHLRSLVRFMDTEIIPKTKYIASKECLKIFFHDLWHLFQPGNEVVDQGEKQGYRVVRIEIPRHKVEDPWLRWTYRKFGKADDSDEDDAEEEEDDPVKVHCAYIDFDGKQFGPVSVKFTIQPYGGLRDIRSLPVYPLRYAKDTKFREKLIDRGKMLLDVAKFRPMYYTGYTLDTRDEIDSQVVVDFSEALANEARRKWTPKIDSLRTAPDKGDVDEKCSAACCAGQGVGDDKYIDSRLTEDFVKSLLPDRSLGAPSLLLSPRPLEETQVNEPTEDEYVVMTYRVFAFVLRSRKWAQLDLTFLRYQNKDARDFTLSAFDQLALPDGHRDMVESLVTQHFRDRKSNSNEQTDIVKGKGKGLILLLHGAPGVGKTTTAEGVAERFQKPLFQITCGDLGNTARDVEGELEKNFSLASRWGCILLLDEADVFLSARERKDFERNGLVAVFLRVLEYYAGILFLTTNRIGDFDEAFASRIHMSLYYPELDEAKTRKVFTLNLDLIEQRFRRQGRKITYDASSIESFAGHHFHNFKYNRWNGRQIRNLCQTALALAEFDAHGRGIDAKIKSDATIQLQLKYFETVRKAYLDFGQYLGDVRGTQSDQRAYDNALRSKKDTPFQTTPSRFSARGDDPGARHVSSLSESQSSAQGDPFTSFGGQNYPSGGSSNMRSSYPQQYSPGHGYTSNPGMARYDGPQGYPQASSQQNQQGQHNPNYYPIQQVPQMGFNPQAQQNIGAQNMGGPNVGGPNMGGPNMGGPNMGGPNVGAPNMGMPYNQPGQAHPMQQPQGQNLQAPQYSYPAMQGGQQSDTMGGANSPGQVAQGGPVGEPRFGGGPGSSDR